MLTRQLLVQALSRTPNSDVPAAYDEVTAIRIAEDCLAIFAHEITQVAPSLLAQDADRGRSPGSDRFPAAGGSGSAHGEDLLLVPTRNREMFLPEDTLAAEALRRQSEWLRPLCDDVF